MIPGPKGDDPFFKDFFDQFFGRSGPGRREEFQTPGLGSGVIVDKRGYVLTNFHVIRGADAVTVRLADKQEFRGRIVGSDSKTDIASRASTPTASPAAAICELTPGPDSRSTRAARQMGHHAHSGASSAGGTVALAHTSAGPPPTPSMERIWSLTSRLTLRAPERTIHRWKSPIGSWPDRLGSCVTSRLLSRLRPGP